MFKKKKDEPQEPAGEQPRPLPRKKGAAKEKSALNDAKILSMVTAAAVAVAVAALAYSYFVSSSAQSELAHVQGSTQNVVVAAKDITQGTVLSADNLTVVQVPASFVVAGGYGTIDDLVGQSALIAIPANTQMTGGMLAGDKNSESLAAKLPTGTVGYAVAVDSQTGVSNLIKQGDHVDVMLNGNVVVNDVVVAALDSVLSGDTPTYATVTVELRPDQAQALQAAQDQGDVRFVLRPTVDIQG